MGAITNAAGSPAIFQDSSSYYTISTAQKKFGAASFKGDGSNTVRTLGLNMPGALYGTGDFTIEFFINLAGTVGGNCWLLDGRGTANSDAPNATNAPMIYVASGATTLTYYVNAVGIFTTASLGTGTWHHYAISRVAGVLYIGLDGAIVYSGAHTNNYDNNNLLFLGCNGTGSSYVFNGYVDELRITRGVGRYTGTYTVPSAAFDNTDPYWSSVATLLHFDAQPVTDCVGITINEVDYPIQFNNASVTNYAHKLSGTVKEGIAPSPNRRVVAFTRSSGQYIGSAISDINGVFSMTHLADRTGSLDKLVVVAFDDDGVTPNYNAQICDLISQST